MQLVAERLREGRGASVSAWGLVVGPPPNPAEESADDEGVISVVGPNPTQAQAGVWGLVMGPNPTQAGTRRQCSVPRPLPFEQPCVREGSADWRATRRWPGRRRR